MKIPNQPTTNGNDFRRVVVTVESQKSAKRRVHSQAPHVCVHRHDLLVPQNDFGSFLTNCRDHLFFTVQYIGMWITRTWSRECYAHDIFSLISVTLQSVPTDENHHPLIYISIISFLPNSLLPSSEFFFQISCMKFCSSLTQSRSS